MESELEIPRIDLSVPEMDMLIGMWIQRPILWNRTVAGYKDKYQKRQAMYDMAQAIGRGWTVDQVKRKLESMYGYYRVLRKERANTAEGCWKKNKKTWACYDKMDSFMKYADCRLSKVSTSVNTFDLDLNSVASLDDQQQPPHDDSDSFTIEIAKDMDNDGHSQGLSSFSNGSSGSEADNDFVRHRLDAERQDEQTVDEQTASSPMQLPTTVAPSQASSMSKARPRKKPRLLSGQSSSNNSCKDDFETESLKLMKDIQVLQDRDGPNWRYAQTVADRLDQLKSSRRLAMLKHTIDQSIHQALLEEMSSDDEL